MTKLAKFTIFVKYCFLIGLILLSVVLCIEALIPGEQSAASSNDFGDKVDEVVTQLSPDEIKNTRPQSIAILLGGEKPDKDAPLQMNCGETVALSLEILPNDTSVNYRGTEWQSDASNIVSVDGNGKLTARSPGLARVSVTLTADPEKVDYIDVVVSEVYAESLSIAISGKDSAEVMVGNTVTAKATFTPSNTTAKSLKYTSSDTSVATVTSGGVVTGKKEGTATITATYTSQTNKDGAKVTIVSNSVTVTVVPNTELPPDTTPVPLTDLTLSQDVQNGVTAYVDEQFTISVGLVPSNTTEKTVIWTVSDEDVLRSDGGGKFTPLKKGIATVTVSSALHPEISKEVEVTVCNKSIGAIRVSVSGKGVELVETDNPDEFTMEVIAGTTGITFEVTADIPEYYVTYSSSDAEIAEIFANGELSTLKSSEKAENGVVVLTITVADNGEFSSEDGNVVHIVLISLTVSRQPISATISGWSTFVRKLFGHFGAFLVLGIFAAVTFILFSKKNWKSKLGNFVLAVCYGFFMASLTEMFQMDLFTTGRGSSFTDVVLDCQGYMPAVLIIYGLFFIGCAAFALYNYFKKRKMGTLLADAVMGAEGLATDQSGAEAGGKANAELEKPHNLEKKE